MAGARELSHLPMCFLALFPNGIERQIWRQSLRIHNTVQNGRFARPERALEIRKPTCELADLPFTVASNARIT